MGTKRLTELNIIMLEIRIGKVCSYHISTFAVFLLKGRQYMNRNKRMKNEFDNKRNSRGLEIFLSLPKKAQELIFASMNNYETAHWFSTSFCYTEEDVRELTPIEIIFDIAFSIYSDFAISDDTDDVFPCSHLGLLRQDPVYIDGKKYIPDFLFDSSWTDCYDSPKADGEKNIKVVIECDGHDFHEKTKQQVARDNERELALKMNGYDVIRFSGSQIYNDPLGCAEKAFKYIANRIGECKE